MTIEYERVRPRRRTARAVGIVANGLIVVCAVYFVAHLITWGIR